MSSAIELNRELKKRLLALIEKSRCLPKKTTDADDGNSNGEEWPPQKQSSVLPVHTIQSLLSRDPQQLANDLNVSISDVSEIRTQFAQDFMALSPVVRQATRIISTVNHALRMVESTQQNNRICGKTAKDDDLQRFFSFRPIPIFPGAVTALDHCLYQSCHRMQRVVPTFKKAVSTGSFSLDTLISSAVTPLVDMSNILTNGSRDGTPKQRLQVSSDSGYHQNEIGLEFGYVTEAVGGSSTGKTQLALSLACQASSMQGIHVHYLVSGGNSAISLSRRASKIMASCCERNQNRFGNALTCLERITFHSISDGFSLLAVLTKLENNSMQNNEQVEPFLVVCDSAQGCLTTTLLGSGAAFDRRVGTGFISEVSLALRRHARNTGNAVFVTNGTVAGKGATLSTTKTSMLQPALGLEWRAADVKIFLNVIDDGSHSRSAIKKVTATLVRHFSKIENENSEQVIIFGISTIGITDISC